MGIEAGTGFGYTWQIAVAHDAGFGIVFAKILQQREEGVLLFLGTRVGSLAFLIETAFIADGDGTVVVVPGMDALDRFGQNGDDIAIAPNVVVVTGLAETGVACGDEAFDGEGAVGATAGAVNDEEFHSLVLQGFQSLVHFTQD